jgi:DUF1680 family protein
MGLIDMYEYAGNKTALDIAKNMAGWFLRWTAKFSRQEMDNILEVETGGMLEIWAALYGITGKKEYLTLMDRYYRGRLFDPLLAGEDVLTNMHANTTIPEVLGAARAYEVTGDEKWLNIAKAYWKGAVTDRGQYCTGGQTSGEIWSPPMELAARLGDKNQEHCTVYNMMRLADFLFRVTGDKKYADYWEQNLYNGIFAQGYWKGSFTHGYKSAYPDSGLLTYFLPLRAGARKAWASPKGDFFCCHGTLVQANASLNRGIYYIGKNEKHPSLAICQFFDSSVAFAAGGVSFKLEQHINTLSGSTHLSSDSTGVQAVNKMAMDIPHNPQCQRCEFKITGKGSAAFELKIRLPWWAKGTPALNINGKKEKPLIADGFIVIKKTWANDAFYVDFQKSITAWPLPDKKDTVAFMYGPVALAGLTDEEIVLKGNLSKPEDILAHDNERDWGNWMNTFKTVNQEKNIPFIPINAVGYEQYTVYFNVEAASQKHAPGINPREPRKQRI